MDSNNKYKDIINRIYYDEAIETSLYENSQKSLNEYTRKKTFLEKCLKFYSKFLIGFIIIAVISFVFILVFASQHPLTPKSVVNRFYSDYNNHHWSEIEELVSFDYDKNIALFPLVGIEKNKRIYVERNDDDTIVILTITYLDEKMLDYKFAMERINGKWYIKSINSDYLRGIE